MFLNDFAYSLFNICGDIMRELSDQEVELFDKIGFIPKLNTASSQVRSPVSQPTARRGAHLMLEPLFLAKFLANHLYWLGNYRSASAENGIR